ncbi:LysR family transcriptional regulator [Lactobacillus sp. LL6]|uniref:LysR family transcriptional regulator n=1 Tax=Lactobacillus sp. LL6 TaxID=2596827 RepID=UPI001184CA8E|nr:LysR family transcriptional regulator [Lactobacillus sp. LL6]TSO25456.1 LysR family transcriptional regulator [Lactobacillus sp. LL6]
MDLDRLRLFETVVEIGSFQKAAEKNYISQRAVSQSMSKLENELNLKLFIRENNKIIVTEVGQQFYLKVKDMLHNFDINIKALQNYKANPFQELKIGYFSPFEGNLLMKKLIKVKENGSNIKYTVVEESIEHLISDVKLKILDCALILEYGNHNEIDSSLESKVIYKNQMVMGVSKLNKNSKLVAFPIKELNKKPILYYSHEESHYLKKEFISSLPSTIDHIHLARMSALEQMQMIVSLNQAIAYYPNGLIQETMIDSGLINYLPLDIKNNSQQYSITCIYLKNTSKRKEINSLF